MGTGSKLVTASVVLGRALWEGAGQRPLVESATFWGRASGLREPCP